MFIKITTPQGDTGIVNTDNILYITKWGEDKLKIYFTETEYLYVKSNLNEFYQRLVEADRKDQH